MQKLLTLLASVSVMGILTIGFSSCKDDEDPPVNAVLEFSSASKNVAEGEQNVKANIVLDKAAPADLIISYSLSGSATRKVGGGDGDYEVVGPSGEVEIAKGETTGEIVFNILEDTFLEQDEKIIITIDDVSSSQVDIGIEDQMEIIIEGGGNVTATFAAATLTVNEADEGIHELVINLSAAAGFDVTVEYSIAPFLSGGNFVAGTAIDSLRGTAEDIPSDYWDYHVDSETVGSLTIPAGETIGIIGINVYSDFRYENDDKIEITLNASTGVTVGATPKMTITIEQEDGNVVELDWADGTTADMDLFLWLTVPDEENNPVQIPFASSVNADTDGFEQCFIPDVISEFWLTQLEQTTLEYGAGYVYYSGDVDPLNFEVAFVNIADGEAELIELSEGTYTEANLNPWDENEDGVFSTIIVQTFDYTGGSLANISGITVPTAGSRVRSVEIEQTLKRNKVSFPVKKAR